MTKKFIFTALILLAASFVFAGGLLTNTNQSIHFLRNPARDASTQIDAAYTNPAGLVFLSDGFHISLNNQSAFQTRTITSTFAPFASNGGSATKLYTADTKALIVPSLHAAYKKDRYVFSAAFGVEGGGGVATFKQGLPSLEAPVSLIPSALTAKGVKTSTYSLDQYMEGKQYIFGLQLNGSYKITEHISGAVGLRVNIVSNTYKGHLTNIMINPVHPSLNPLGTMMSASTFFGNASKASTAAANSLNPIVAGGYGSATFNQLVAAGKLTQNQVNQLSAGLGTNVSTMKVSDVQTLYNGASVSYQQKSDATADKYLDSKQSGMGFTPIFSLDYNSDRLNAAVKYEMKSSITLTNKTTVDDTGLYADGATTPSDIPAYLAVGAEYKLTESWKLSGGYHHFFDSDAKMAKDKQQYINGGINEYLLGTEYEIGKKFLLSAGGQITRTSVTDDYQTDMSFSLNSYSIGFGGAVNLTSDLRLNVAYFFTNYSDWTKASANYNGTTVAGTDMYARTNKVFGIGLDYKF